MSHANKFGGSADKNQKKFARISDYLETHHKKVYDLLDNAGLLSSLNPRKGRGLTFVIPDATLTEQIRKLLNSDDAEKATDIISSLILLGHYSDTEDFAAESDDVPTMLGTRLDIKEIKNDRVILGNGAELTLDKKYTPMERVGPMLRGNTAVWHLKGVIDLENAPKTEYKYSNATRVKKEKKGGDDSSEAAAVNNAFASEFGFQYKEFIHWVMRVIRHWESQGQKYRDELLKARALFSPNQAFNFMLLFSAPVVFDALAVKEAVMAGELADKDVDCFNRFTCTDMEGSAVTTKAGMVALFSKCGNFLHTLSRFKDDGKKAEEVVKLYAGIDASNEVLGIKNVYPEALAHVFKSNPGLHLLLDELRHDLAQLCKEKNGLDGMDARRRFFEIRGKYMLAFNERNFTAYVQKITTRPMLEPVDPYLRSFLDNGFMLCVSCAVTGGDDDMDDFKAYEVKLNNEPFTLSKSGAMELKKFLESGGKLSDIEQM